MMVPSLYQAIGSGSEKMYCGCDDDDDDDYIYIRYYE